MVTTIGKRYLKDYFPEFLLDWDNEKNKGIDKNKITIGSSKISINWKCYKCGFEWVQKVDRRVLHRTECKICSNKNRLLKFTNPEIFSEIDKEKNHNLNFELLTKGSSKKIWWKCKNGHSWFQNIDTRTKLGSNCRECENDRNSFLKTHPHLLLEWDFKKNKLLNPELLTRGSNKKVWWICKNCKNSFQCVIDKRTRGTNCNKCRKRVQPKIPLTERFNHLLVEWNYKKNKDISPNIVSEGSNIPVHWICKKGHKFQMEPYYRTKQGLGCPTCRGLKVDSSNSLKSLRPDLCKEWDYDKNNILPSRVTVKSNSKVWWKCNNGHSWESLIYNRTKKSGTKCPMCSGRTSSNKTSLSYLFPDLMKEWDPMNEQNPNQIRPGSHKIVGWICQSNPKHKWKSPIYSRTSKSKFGCPFCSGKYTLKEESIGFKHPKFMDEWDYTRNKGVDPFTVSHKSDKKVWWKCNQDKNHYWRTTISHRNEGTKCPYCSGTSMIIRTYQERFKTPPTQKIFLYYLIFFSKEEVFYKIGITKNLVEERYNLLFQKTGYKVVKVRVITGTLSSIVNREQTIHRKVTRNLDVNLIRYRPKKYFGGIGECYNLPQSLVFYESKLKTNYERCNKFQTLFNVVKY
jgi:hypothetical protein